MATGNSKASSNGGSPVIVLSDVHGGVQPVSSKQVLAILRRRWWLALITLAAVMSAGLAYLQVQRPIYEATAEMVVAVNHTVPVTAEDLGMLSDMMSLAREKTAQAQAQLMASREILDRVAAELGTASMQRGFRGDTNAEDYGILPEWAITATASKSSDVVTVTARAYDPEVAADLANLMVTTYIEHDRGLMDQTITQARQFISEQMDAMQHDLSAARLSLAAVKRRTGLIAPENQLPSYVTKELALEAELEKSKIDLLSSQRKAALMRQQLAEQGQEVQSSLTIQRNPQYQAAMNKLSELQAQSVSVAQEYQPGSKQVRKIEAETEGLRQQLKQIADTVVASRVRARNPLLDTYLTLASSNAAAAARISALERLVASRRGRMQALPADEASLAQLTSKVKRLEATHDALAQKYYALLFNEQSTLPNALFAATARPPMKASYPNKRKGAVAFALMGAVLAIAICALAEGVDRRVRAIPDATQLASLPVLGRIPRLRKMDRSCLMAAASDSCNGFIEAFRVLRNHIYAAAPDPPKLLAVTSPGREEGKGTVAVNLAPLVAMCSRRVLIVECDFRQPTLHTRVRDARNFGLSNVVMGMMPVHEAIVPTSHEHVYCLPCGPAPANPAEFLMSGGFHQLLRDLTKDFDLVILDCPPCAGLSDMEGISGLVDHVLVVVSLDRTRKQALCSGVETLQEIGAPLIGMVVNRACAGRDTYDYYRLHGSPPGGPARTRALATAERSGLRGGLSRLATVLRTKNGD